MALYVLKEVYKQNVLRTLLIYQSNSFEHAPGMFNNTHLFLICSFYDLSFVLLILN